MGSDDQGCTSYAELCKLQLKGPGHPSNCKCSAASPNSKTVTKSPGPYCCNCNFSLSSRAVLVAGRRRRGWLLLPTEESGELLPTPGRCAGERDGRGWRRGEGTGGDRLRGLRRPAGEEVVDDGKGQLQLAKLGKGRCRRRADRNKNRAFSFP